MKLSIIPAIALAVMTAVIVNGNRLIKIPLYLGGVDILVPNIKNSGTAHPFETKDKRKTRASESVKRLQPQVTAIFPEPIRTLPAIVVYNFAKGFKRLYSMSMVPRLTSITYRCAISLDELRRHVPIILL